MIHSVSVEPMHDGDHVTVRWSAPAPHTHFTVPIGTGRAVAALLIPDDGKTVRESEGHGYYTRWFT